MTDILTYLACILTGVPLGVVVCGLLYESLDLRRWFTRPQSDVLWLVERSNER